MQALKLTVQSRKSELASPLQSCRGGDKCRPRLIDTISNDEPALANPTRAQSIPVPIAQRILVGAFLLFFLFPKTIA
jgi:hypothetical protein